MSPSNGPVVSSKVPGAAEYVVRFLFHEGIALLAAVLYALFFDVVGTEENPLLRGSPAV